MFANRSGKTGSKQLTTVPIESHWFSMFPSGVEISASAGKQTSPSTHYMQAMNMGLENVHIYSLLLGCHHIAQPDCNIGLHGAAGTAKKSRSPNQFTLACKTLYVLVYAGNVFGGVDVGTKWWPPSRPVQHLQQVNVISWYVLLRSKAPSCRVAPHSTR
eukprot:356550-Chlamydomonas_euryale.AAC.2